MSILFKYHIMASLFPFIGKGESIHFNFLDLFKSSPVIYTVLTLMLLASTTIWFEAFLSLKKTEWDPSEFIETVRQKLSEKRYEEALFTCQKENSVVARIIACGIATRLYGEEVMMEAMLAEGKRCGHTFSKKIAKLKDIAVLSPLLGFLGSVLGFFYAFYKVQQSQESLQSIFEGLGLNLATTFLGVLISLYALILHKSLKYRVLKLLNGVENETQSLGALLATQTSAISSEGGY